MGYDGVTCIIRNTADGVKNLCASLEDSRKQWEIAPNPRLDLSF